MARFASKRKRTVHVRRGIAKRKRTPAKRAIRAVKSKFKRKATRKATAKKVALLGERKWVSRGAKQTALGAHVNVFVPQVWARQDYGTGQGQVEGLSRYTQTLTMRCLVDWSGCEKNASSLEYEVIHGWWKKPLLHADSDLSDIDFEHEHQDTVLDGGTHLRDESIGMGAEPRHTLTQMSIALHQYQTKIITGMNDMIKHALDSYDYSSIKIIKKTRLTGVPRLAQEPPIPGNGNMAGNLANNRTDREMTFSWPMQKKEHLCEVRVPYLDDAMLSDPEIAVQHGMGNFTASETRTLCDSVRYGPTGSAAAPDFSVAKLDFPHPDPNYQKRYACPDKSWIPFVMFVSKDILKAEGKIRSEGDSSDQAGLDALNAALAAARSKRYAPDNGTSCPSFVFKERMTYVDQN